MSLKSTILLLAQVSKSCTPDLNFQLCIYTYIYMYVYLIYVSLSQKNCDIMDFKFVAADLENKQSQHY